MTLGTSPLLLLPRELRDEVYFCLFNATCLSFSLRPIKPENDRQLKALKPAADSLAILQTCRQIHAEARSAWLDRVNFSFDSPGAFMKKLSTLSADFIGGMRHMRIFLHYGEFKMTDGVPAIYFLPTMFRLFPALRLDALTVIHACICKVVSIRLLELFLRSGQGWRELRFLAHRSAPLRYIIEEDENPHDVEFTDYPHWKYACTGSTLKRDGNQSGSSVQILRRGIPRSYGEIVKLLDEETVDPNELQIRALTMQRDLPQEPQEDVGREQLVIVKRGRNANISPDTAYEQFRCEALGNIVAFKNEQGWEQFFERCYEPCTEFFERADDDDFDRYAEIDEFTWQLDDSHQIQVLVAEDE